MGTNKYMTALKNQFGVSVEYPTMLQERYRLSFGVKLLGPEDAMQGGFRPIPDVRAGIPVPLVDQVNPTASLQMPSESQLRAITATHETRRVMRIMRISRAAAERLLVMCSEATDLLDQPENYRHLASGIMGIPRAVREDPPNEINVSISKRYGKKVGDHIDEWPDPDTSFLIANMGPGVRWHRVVPDLNRDVAGGPTRASLAGYISDHSAPHTIPVHWFKLEPPQGDYVEAIVDSPVAWAQHEGSTIGSHLSSLAIMCVTHPRPGLAT